MSDLLAKCDWLNGDVLVLTLPQDPSSIHVRLFDSKHAPRKVYVPESYPKQWELGADYQRLNDENAKLRELVDELWALAYGYVYDESELDRARELMRELGIEVGE